MESKILTAELLSYINSSY